MRSRGYPRFTKDIDIFFDESPGNVERLYPALVAFGFREDSLSRESLERPGNVIVIGIAPVRIDLVNRIDGLTFAAARPNVVRSRYGDVEARFIGREDLLQNKRSTSRTKDKADVEELS
jgi:hypothetical protein